MKTIWKYNFGITGEQEIKIPVGAKIISIGTQQDEPCLWAVVDDKTKDYTMVSIAVVGTGNPFWCEGFTYMGTIFTHGGIHGNKLVWHVFIKEWFYCIDKKPIEGGRNDSKMHV